MSEMKCVKGIALTLKKMLSSGEIVKWIPVIANVIVLEFVTFY